LKGSLAADVLFMFAEKRVFINCCINILHINYQVTNTTTMLLHKTVPKNVCFLYCNSMQTYIVVYFLKPPMLYELEFCSTVGQLNYLNKAKDFKNVSPYLI
jgi:hypothetical protein